MSDSSLSDDDSDSGEGGVSLTGFLFGNIDPKTGQLEDDFLDADSKRQITALNKLGLGGIMSEVMPQDEEKSASSTAPRKRRRHVGLDSSSDEDDMFSDEDDEEKATGSHLDEGSGKFKKRKKNENQLTSDGLAEKSTDFQTDAEKKTSDSSNLFAAALADSTRKQNTSLVDSDYDDEEESESQSSSCVSSATELTQESVVSEPKSSAETKDGSDVGDDSDFKDPSAVDYSDITELADDESIENEKSELVHDSSSGQVLESGNKDDRSLMPPPPVPSSSSGTLAATSSNGKIDVVSSDPVGYVQTEGADHGDSSQEIEFSNSYLERRLETPLAAMLPSKYAGIDVTNIFPDFRPGQVCRFSRLFGPGKPSSLPQVWKNVRKRRRKRKIFTEGQAAADAAEEKDREKRGWVFDYDGETDDEMLASDEEEALTEWSESPALEEGQGRKEKSDNRSANGSLWRHGPAQLWYDMLEVPDDEETFDYGFASADNSKRNENGFGVSEDDPEEDTPSSAANGETHGNLLPNGRFPDEAFHLVTQLDWENSVIWDGNDTKFKKQNKNKAAGWVPSGRDRTAHNFSQTGKSSPVATGTGMGKGSQVMQTISPFGNPGGPMIQSPTPTVKKSSSILKGEESSGIPGDDTWYSIFPVETSELVYGSWEDEVIWDVDRITSVPEPKVLALDPNDENIVLCMPDDVDPSANQGNVVPVKVKIPHPHVKKSKILLGKAGVINVIEEDSPPPSPKNDDKDPYNISNDEYYQPKHTEQSMLKISASGNIIQHSTPVVELRAPFIPTHLNEFSLRNFHRPSLRCLKNGPLKEPGPHSILPLTKHIKKKAKAREQERLAAGGGDIFFMRAPEDLSGKDGEMILLEYCEEYPPLLNQVICRFKCNTKLS